MITPRIGRAGLTAAGAFVTTTEARRAVELLLEAGLREDQIGIISPDRQEGSRSGPSGWPNDPTHSRWEEGAGAGAAVGGAAGLGLGLAVAAGVLSPIGPVVAGGALVGLLASAGTGATVGTVLGGLIGLNVAEDDARWYEVQLAVGRTLVLVHRADARLGEIRAIFQRAGVEAEPPPGAGPYPGGDGFPVGSPPSAG